MKLPLAITLLALSSCATPKSNARAFPDGTISVTCTMNINACYERAAQVCPQGYDIAHSSNGKSAQWNGLDFMTVEKQNILIRCKADASTQTKNQNPS